MQAFLVSRLAAGFLSLGACFIAATTAQSESFVWQVDEESGTADLRHGDQLALRYMFAFDTSSDERRHDTYKVFHHVFGPQSGEQITKGPGGKFTHHRGLFLGWNRTAFQGTTLDFWHCKNGAHLRHVRFMDKAADENHGQMTAEIHWNDPQGQPVIREFRTVKVTREPDTDGWQIDWSSQLESLRGEIKLAGDRQHAGFQFRAAQPVADQNGATYLRPAKFPQQPEAIQVNDKGDPPAHIDLGWFANTFELSGSRYTVEYFDNPTLPKPSLFSERPYGRFGTYFSTKLQQGTPLTLTYRVVVSEGESPEVSQIQTRYKRFVGDLNR